MGTPAVHPVPGSPGDSRRRLRFPVLVLLLAFVPAACGGDSDPATAGGPGPTNGSMSASVDGSSWSATGQLQGLRMQGFISLAAPGPGGSVISFAFPDAPAPVTHTLGTAVGLNATYAVGTSQWTAGAAGGSATVTVTALDDTRVAGTFSFTLNAFEDATPATRTITNGQFE
ncbi:MAG: hypothetical protein EA352_08195 [Gemmatimonadales bacterium]|nr:MAG: hypothetical protein EA352_08195 [Gemmatimonadales bacterium]